jgi:hypothetical protein
MQPSGFSAHRGTVHRKEDSDETHTVLIGSDRNFIPTASLKLIKKNCPKNLRRHRKSGYENFQYSQKDDPSPDFVTPVTFFWPNA